MAARRKNLLVGRPLFRGSVNRALKKRQDAADSLFTARDQRATALVDFKKKDQPSVTSQDRLTFWKNAVDNNLLKYYRADQRVRKVMAKRAGEPTPKNIRLSKQTKKSLSSWRGPVRLALAGKEARTRLERMQKLREKP